MHANSIEAEQSAMDELLQEYANAMAGEGSVGNTTTEIETPTEPEETSIWTYDRATQTVTNGTQTLNIGDYVNYDCVTGATIPSYKSEKTQNGYGDQIFTLADYKYGWRVLGANDDGELLLISEDFVPLSGGYTDETTERTYFYIGNDSDATLAQSAYVNGVQELKNICAIYGQGKGAIGATSVTVEDINKITGYNPETAEYLSGTIEEYGNEVTYTLTSGVVKYIGTKYPTDSTSSRYSVFEYYTGSEWKKLEEGESVTIKSNRYHYYPYSLTTDSSTEGILKGIEITSIAYNVLFTNSSTGADSVNKNNSSGYYYWLADSFNITNVGFSGYGINSVHDGYLGAMALYYSDDVGKMAFQGVRPVVTLSNDVSLIDSKTTKDGCALYNID